VFFQVRNSQISTVTLQHTDPSQTVFAQLTFIHSIASVNGVIPCDTCPVPLNVRLTPGSYEVTVGPPTVVFALSSSPTMAISYGTFGDLSVYTQSPRYASAAAYGQALQMWRERASDRWILGRNSSHTGASQITSALDAPGRYLIAAPK
jgi:hypothetical protein